MKTKFFRKNASVKAGASVRRWRWLPASFLAVAMTALLLWPMVLAAQNGVILSNLVSGAGTVTFNVSWDERDVPEVWSDTVWVFVDYNKAGKMARLPLSGATLTNSSWRYASVIFGEAEGGNDQGAWVVGNARTQGYFSTKVSLYSATTDLPGACVYASNYPPKGLFTTPTNVSFTGTPLFKIVLKEPNGSGTLTGYADRSYITPAGYTLVSFTDGTGAPGILPCTWNYPCPNQYEDIDVTINSIPDEHWSLADCKAYCPLTLDCTGVTCWAICSFSISTMFWASTYRVCRDPACHDRSFDHEQSFTSCEEDKFTWRVWR